MNRTCKFYSQRHESERACKIDACCPGYIGTNLTFFRWAVMCKDGAMNALVLATLVMQVEAEIFSNKEEIVYGEVGLEAKKAL